MSDKVTIGKLYEQMLSIERESYNEFLQLTEKLYALIQKEKILEEQRDQTLIIAGVKFNGLFSRGYSSTGRDLVNLYRNAEEKAEIAYRKGYKKIEEERLKYEAGLEFLSDWFYANFQKLAQEICELLLKIHSERFLKTKIADSNGVYSYSCEEKKLSPLEQEEYEQGIEAIKKQYTASIQNAKSFKVTIESGKKKVSSWTPFNSVIDPSKDMQQLLSSSNILPWDRINVPIDLSQYIGELVSPTSLFKKKKTEKNEAIIYTTSLHY